jgi:glucose-1-phosphate thymidylyltransferase
MKGIVLAGGTGSRLWPLTWSVSKQLLPIYNKPLIYYPLSVLIQAGISEVLIITTGDDQASFKKVLGDGSSFGIGIQYAIQERPEGIAQAFIIGKDFIGSDDVALILGDNLFYGSALEDAIKDGDKPKGCRIFTYQVANPVEYGVLNLDSDGKPLLVEEKPKNPTSNRAITGLYFFDCKVVNYVESIKPSARGELEITSLMQRYIESDDLDYLELPSGVAWLDTGTPKSLNDAAQFVRVLEERTGKRIACLEEIAFNRGLLSKLDLKTQSERYGKSDYGDYLRKLAEI